MNRSEFIKEFAAANGMSKEIAKVVVCTVTGFLAKKVKEEEKLYIYGLGTFKRRHKPARTINHPSTGELLDVPAKDYVSFELCNELENDVKGGGFDADHT